MTKKHFQTQAKLENLQSMIGFVLEAAEGCGASAEAVMQIELALEEALVNIINYAYKDAAETGDIHIVCDCGVEKELVIEIKDHGAPFDVLAKEDPDTTLDIEERQIGGLGIFLVKQMMDETRYQRVDNANVLTLIKCFQD